jgi:hypothetical protein
MGRGVRRSEEVWTKDEPMWVVIHKCMDTAQGISLYSYLYRKLAKCRVFLQQNQRTRGQNRFCLEVVGVAQIMYTHVSTCKSNKIKIFKKERK